MEHGTERYIGTVAYLGKLYDFIVSLDKTFFE